MIPWFFSKRALYFVPHQDDELLTMGADICDSLEKGWDVHVILCTDGANSRVRGVLADGKDSCFHEGAHGYSLSKAEFSASRDLEFFDSCLALGVKKSNIHIPPNRPGDGSITEQQALEIMMFYLKKLGKHSLVCTMSSATGSTQHRDHKVLGRAADQLLRQKIIRKYRAFIEPLLFEKAKDSAKLIPVEPTVIYCSSGKQEAIRNAGDAYALWDPKQQRYAVGYHSVAVEFEELKKEPKSCWFLKWDEETMSWWNRIVWNHKKWKKLYCQRQLFYVAEPCDQPNMMGLRLFHFNTEEAEGYQAFCTEHNIPVREKDLERLRDGSSFWCVLMKNGRLASSGWLAWKQHFYIGETDFGFDMAQSQSAILFDFNTRTEYRGRGYYGILLRAIMANADGPEKYVIYTSPSNHASARGILKAGFRFQGELNAQENSLEEFLKDCGFTAIERTSSGWESKLLSRIERWHAQYSIQ